jgi:mRNA interferase HigB
MHVISNATIREYYEKHATAKNPLLYWYKVTKKASWSNMHDLRQDFPQAEMIVNGKVVFNIKSNDFRLVGLLGFRTKKVYVLWIGTHAEYDKIRIKDL